LYDVHQRPIYDLFFASNNPLGHVKMKEAMWKVDRSGTYSFSDGTDPNQVVLFRADPAAALGPMLCAYFGNREVDVREVFRFTDGETAYLEQHARKALLALEDASADASERIQVRPLKRDGTPRRPRTFPAGTLVRFLTSRRTP